MAVGYAFGGFGVETSMRKDVAGDRTHRNTKTNIACCFANSDLSSLLFLFNTSYLYTCCYLSICV